MFCPLTVSDLWLHSPDQFTGSDPKQQTPSGPNDDTTWKDELKTVYGNEVFQ